MREVVERFLACLKDRRRYSGNTVSAYRNDLMQLIHFLSGREVTDWRSVGKRDLVAFALDLQERGYAQSTVARKLASIRSFCHYLTQSGHVPQDPTDGLDSPQVARRTPKTLSDREVALLLELPARSQTPKGLRDRAILELLYATGMRVSELTALNAGDVDLDRGKVKCGAGTSSERVVPINRDALRALRTYLEQGREELVQTPDERALFVNHRGERLSRQGLWLVIKHYVRELGLGDNVTPHTLRHSAAAHKLRRGANLSEVQQLLGHSSPSSTQVYARIARGSQSSER